MLLANILGPDKQHYATGHPRTSILSQSLTTVWLSVLK